MIENPSCGRHEFESGKRCCDFSGGAQRSVLHVNDPKKTGARSAAKIHLYYTVEEAYGNSRSSIRARIVYICRLSWASSKVKDTPGIPFPIERKEKRNRAVLYGIVLYICTGCNDFNNLNDPNPEKENIRVVISESFQSLKNFPTKRLAESEGFLVVFRLTVLWQSKVESYKKYICYVFFTAH
jgi:hypothetical protein